MGKKNEIDAAIEEIIKSANAILENSNRIAEYSLAVSKASAKKTAPAKEEKPLTLEDVRAVLADKSREGHTTAVRTLLLKYGASKLSEVDPENYAAILKEAEGFSNAG